MESGTKGIVKVHQREEKEQERENPRRKISVGGLMVKQVVDPPRTNVTTNILVKNAEKEDMESPHALRRNIRVVTHGSKPKHLRYNIWDPDSDFTPNISDWTLTAETLEGPPQSKLNDEVVPRTIRNHPELFKIVTPINVDVFERYISLVGWLAKEIKKIRYLGNYVDD